MNYDVLYQPRVLAGNLNLEAYVVYEDAHVKCYTLREAVEDISPTTNELHQLIPDHRCYRLGGKKTERGNKHLIIPKHNDRVMQIMYPGSIWIENKKTLEIIDCSYLAFLCSHDDFNEANADKFINFYRYRQENYYLAESIDNISKLPELRNSWQLFTVLGAHFDPAQVPDSYTKVVDNWNYRMQDLFSNQFWVGYLALQVHHEICMALELPRSTSDVRWNLMLQIITDDLQVSYKKLLDMTTANLSVDVQESKHQRLKAVRAAVNNWFGDSKIYRISSKCSTTHGEHKMVMYQTLFCHHMTQMVLHALDTEILSMVKTNEE